MNLFILPAPYQLLSAHELIAQAGLTDNHLIIADTGLFARRLFDGVIDHEQWTTVAFRDFRYRFTDHDFDRRPPRHAGERAIEIWLQVDRCRKRLLADRIARRLGRVDNLVLGNYLEQHNPHLRHMANRIPHNRLYLLDVGTDTYRIARQRLDFQAQTIKREPAQPQPIGRLKQQLFQRYARWDLRGVDSVTFFSAYQVEVAGADRLIANDYPRLRSLFTTRPAGDDVWFVGQPLADQGYLTMADLGHCLTAVRSHFAGRALVYAAHPRESQEQLELARSLGYLVRSDDLPLESAITQAPTRPAALAAFFSSVVENSVRIFGAALPVIAFRVPPSLLRKDAPNVAAIYDHLRQMSCEIVEIMASRD